MGILELTIFVSLHYRCYIPNLVEIGQVVLEKMLTHDNGRQLIVIGHLNDYMVTQKVLQMKYFERLTIQNDFKVTRVTSISLDSQNDDEQINL